MQRLIVALVNLAAFAVLAAVLAYWGWRWFGPAPFVAPPPPSVDPVAALAVSPPFGAPSAAAPASLAVAPAAAIDDPRLLGVFAEPGGGGHALFRMPDGSSRLVAAGSEVGPGTTLRAVLPESVTLSGAGGERSIALRPPRVSPEQAPAAAAPSNVAQQPTQAASNCRLPADYKGPVVRLNAELVQGLMAQPESLRAIADAADGALVIRDEAGFAALLGMKKGDRVTQANGIALRAPEDVIVAVLRPLAASQPVRLIGTRGSEPRELMIVNAGACPG